MFGYLEFTEYLIIKNSPKLYAHYHFSRAWYDCSSTMTAKPMETCELHYLMIQFFPTTVTVVLFTCS